MLASSYAALIDAGIRPRLLTLNPCSRAQALSSEVLEPCSVFRAGLVVPVPVGCFLDVLAPVLALLVRAFATPGRRLAGADAFFAGLLEAATRLTLYMAPSTRTASSSGSLESMVTFKIVARLCISNKEMSARYLADEKRYLYASAIARAPRSARQRSSARGRCCLLSWRSPAGTCVPRTTRSGSMTTSTTDSRRTRSSADCLSRQLCGCWYSRRLLRQETSSRH